MALQAYTIDRYVTEPCIHWVIVEDSRMPRTYWEDLLSPYYTRHELRLITDTSEIDGWSTKQGWIRQQVLKMTIANQIKSDYYLILDAKNFFIRPTNINDWPISEGSPRVEESSKSSAVWGPFMDYVVSKHNWELPRYTWGPYTPFRAKTSTVRELLDLDLETMIPELDLKIGAVGTFSEFILYSLYVSNSKGIQLNKNRNNYDYAVTVWRPHHWLDFWRKMSLDDLKKYFDRNTELSIFGVHRLVWEERACAVDIAFWLLDLGFNEAIVQRCILERYAKKTHLAQK